MVSIKVNSINDAPSADAQSLIIDENTSANIELTGNDIDGDVPTFKIDIQPENGELSGEIPDLVYEPNYGFSGLDSFTFVADDGVAASEPVKIEITVNSMPNPFDVNKDGMVDILDIAFVSRYFGKADFPKDLNPDVNRDGEVDSQDLGIVMGNFGVKAE